MRADKAAIGLQRAKIERDVGHRGRQDAAGGTAWEIALEGMAVGYATAELVDQLARGDPGGRQLDARRLDTPGDGEAAQPLAVVTALAGDEAGPLLDDVA